MVSRSGAGSQPVIVWILNDWSFGGSKQRNSPLTEGDPDANPAG
jgi:hypothetical protein